MDLLKKILLLLCPVLICGCQLGYIINSAYHQADLLRKRIPIKKILESKDLPTKKRLKLELVQEVRTFAKEQLGLKVKNNYSTYVELEQDYVTYVVNAAEKTKLETYYWNYPLIGKMPYKGYFRKKDAKELRSNMITQGYDTHLRGVSAYSTLGWFDDPILSSMLNYEDYDLVSTIIHESVHATFFIDDNAEFNERMATYLGNLGANLFYINKKKTPEVIDLAKLKKQDELLFSKFITQKIKKLRTWYKNQESAEKALAHREEQFKEIIDSFKQEVAPKLQTKSYKNFYKVKLNNAKLLLYETYMKDFSDLEKLYIKMGSDYKKIVIYLVKVSEYSNPEKSIQEAVR